MYHTEPPTDKTIRELYMNSSRVAACALRNEQTVRAHRPGRPMHYITLYTVKQISNNEIYLLIKYIKIVLWRVAKRLSYIEDARYLKVNLQEADPCHNTRRKTLYEYRPSKGLFRSCGLQGVKKNVQSARLEFPYKAFQGTYIWDPIFFHHL